MRNIFTLSLLALVLIASGCKKFDNRTHHIAIDTSVAKINKEINSVYRHLHLHTEDRLLNDFVREMESKLNHGQFVLVGQEEAPEFILTIDEMWIEERTTGEKGCSSNDLLTGIYTHSKLALTNTKCGTVQYFEMTSEVEDNVYTKKNDDGTTYCKSNDTSMDESHGNHARKTRKELKRMIKDQPRCNGNNEEPNEEEPLTL